MFSRFQKGTWVIKADGADQRQIAVEARHAVWSPDKRPGHLYQPPVEFPHHLDGIYVMGADGSYKRRLTTDGGTFPQWSPNGTRIVYTSRQLDEIWVMDTNGGDQKQLTTHGSYPVWSPDSTTIAYNHEGGIWVMDAEGANQKQLTTHGAHPVWSPDGTRILYTSSHLDGIYIVEGKENLQRQLTSDGSDPTWSPNGAHIAYTSRSGIWVMDPDGSKQRHLALEYAKGPVWSPDSTRVAYTSRFGGIYVVDANGANQQQLAPDGSDPTWSPNGAHIAYTGTGNDFFLWTADTIGGILVVDAGGGNQQQLAPDGSDPTWSPNGAHIAYVGTAGGIYVMDADAANQRSITLERGLRPQWSTDSQRLAYYTPGGIFVVEIDGAPPQQFTNYGVTPAWSPTTTLTAATEPTTADTPACPATTNMHTPRFLPLTVRMTSSAPQTVKGPFEISIEFSRPVTGFSADEASVVNGHVTTLVDCGSTYRVRISPASVGTVVVRIPRNVARDITNQGNFASLPLLRTGVSTQDLAVAGIDTWDRIEVLRAYRVEFDRSQPVGEYTSRVERCLAGSTSQEFRDSVIQRVNWYRRMAGLEVVAERPEYSQWAQETAMMMSAAGALSHRPGSDWACYTSVGGATANQSNLLLGAVGILAIDGYMRNHGPPNLHVDHRRLLLYPQLLEIGTGDVPGDQGRRSANALYIRGEDVPQSRLRVREQRRFVAWPPPGYVPAETVWGRWSFSVPGADFSHAEVTVTDDQGRVPVEVLVRNPASSGSRNIPETAIVWP